MLLWNDLKVAARLFWRSPAMSLCALATLAVGIGATTAVFAVVHAVLLRPLPFANPDELVWIWSTRVDRDRAFYSIPNFEEYRARNRSVIMEAVAPWSPNLTSGGDPERLAGARVTPAAFDVLGLRAAAGRLLRPGDERADGRAAVLGHGLWQRRFGKSPAAVGATIVLNDETYTVVGVLPPDVPLPGIDTEVVVALDLAADPRHAERGSNFLRGFGRLRPGVTPAAAAADLAIITEGLRDGFPDTNHKLSAPRVVGWHEELTASYRTTLLSLLAAVGFVLLIGCANIAHLLLVHTLARRREIAIRVALGARRRDIVRLLLAQTLLVAGIGGTLGVMGAYWGIDALVSLAPAQLPRLSAIAVDARVLGFALAITVAAGLLAGLAPGLRAARLRTGATNPGGPRSRGLFVALQVAVTFVLLVGAGLLVATLVRIQRVSPGFDAERLLVMRAGLPGSRYDTPEAVSTFYDRLATRLRDLPGVQAAGAVSVLPLSGMNARTDFTVRGRPPAVRTEIPAAQHRWVSPGYFRLMGIPVLAGRDFADTDRRDKQLVVAVDEALARRWLGDQPAVGAHLLFDDGASEPRDVEIVAAVGNVKHVGLDDAPTPTLYGPLHQLPRSLLSVVAPNLNVVARTEGEPLALAGALRRELMAVDPAVPASSVRSMDDVVAASVSARRFTRTLLELFAGAALLLTAIGLYGALSYSVSRRTREIGIRMAIGASRGNVLRLVLRQGLRLVLIGLAAGFVSAQPLARLIQALLYDVPAWDPLTFAAAAALLLAVGALAAYLPARRAAATDPAVVMRAD